ncbi:M23 family metallopeptidase [Microbacterium radiodurans]|uniref:M23 family metallopeptidase n=1 Tax=Microbacterium radiodurans TaxID=661398 RepID=UPI001CC63BB5|nr:M23 family metallopeptidase [Microbacterium radiodurans]
MRSESLESPEECGCAPTPAERSRLAQLISRRGALGLGAVGFVAATAFLAPGGIPSAFGIEGYPSWDDVQRAKNNEAAKGSEIARIEQLIADLTADVANKQAEAERLGQEYAVAQSAYEDAVYRAESLQSQADAQAAAATETARRAGKLAAQLYRNGGDDTSLKLFFSDSAASADDLLARLGTMDKLLQTNRGVYADAVAARDTAQSLSDQASVARDERDRLKQEAEQKLIAAQNAAQAAQEALAAQTEHMATLQAQLAALKDETAATVAGYQAGVEEERRREEERKRREREEAARRAAEEERRRQEAAAAAAAANSGGGGGGGGNSGGGGGGGGNSGGGGGGGAGQVQPSGWVRPGPGYISSWFGNRGTICSSAGCTTGHRGIDFAGGCSAPIYAAASGTVVHAAWTGDWGNYIKVDHGGGIVSAYAHIQNGGYAVGWGQRVSAGQVIAYAGNTGVSAGCHLHFEIYQNGTRIDPAPFLRNRGISV